MRGAAIDPSLQNPDATSRSQQCPTCRLFSPPEAECCDCGYQFATGATGATRAGTEVGPSGVSGWLALLVAGQLVIAPLAIVGSTVLATLTAEEQQPQIRLIAEWGNYKAASWTAAVLFATVSVRAGWGLARGRAWSVVRRATIALWVTGPIAVLTFGVAIPLVVARSLVGISLAEAPSPLVRSIVVALVWTAYLQNSRRVRATYAGPEVAVVPEDA